jgi:hypothetical protein
VSHKFMVGQAVELTRLTLRLAAAGEYKIRCLIPARDSDPGNPCYRVKNADENHERVVFESEITLSPQHA